jgi:hypothetical protein
LVRGHLRNQLPLLRVKNFNNVMSGLLKNGRKEQRFHAHRIGADIA